MLRTDLVELGGWQLVQLVPPSAPMLMWRRPRHAALTATTLTSRRARVSIPQRGWFGKASESADPPADTVEHAPANHDDQFMARRSLRELKKALSIATESHQILHTWDALATHQPVVFENGVARVLSVSDPPADANNDHQVVPIRMVSLPQLLELTRQGARDQVLERRVYLPRSNSVGVGDDASANADETVQQVLPLTQDHVLQVSEEFVARKVLVAMSRVKDNATSAAFMETYEQRELALTDADRELLATDANFRSYFSVMYATAGVAHKVIARSKPFRADLSRFIFNRDSFRSLLHACLMTREGDFAREVIDQAMDRFSLITFNSRHFAAAIHANIRGEPKTNERFANAMHIYRRMRDEAGYILAPYDWSLLFNTCVYLDETDAAIEVFRAYRVHGIAPFQQRFQKAIRIACKNERHDLSIQMAREWVRIESTPPDHPWLITDEQLHQDEAECLNKIMWEMTKGAPTREQVEQVMQVMEARATKAGALVSRRIVTHLMRPDASPAAVLDRFFMLWEACPSVLLRSSFILYLVLEECAHHGWTDKYERVMQYGQEHDIDMPVPTVAKLMVSCEQDGAFENAVLLGELLLRAVPPRHPRSTSIPDQFFETLLRCLAFQQRFQDIEKIADAYQLTKHRGTRTPALVSLIQDAQASVY